MARIEDLDEFLRAMTDGLERPEPGSVPQWDWELQVAPDAGMALREAADHQALDCIIMTDGTTWRLAEYLGLEARREVTPELGAARVTVVPELAPGRWELHRDGAMVRYGTIGDPRGPVEVK
jgi:hypothetical protein